AQMTADIGLTYSAYAKINFTQILAERGRPNKDRAKAERKQYVSSGSSLRQRYDEEKEQDAE
ncbi:MAG: hypothetical protein Q4A32_11405, partial [Lachnospiraceae bacterium]|nr:hypothetical protein [Lachnospiraceae bacterium]